MIDQFGEILARMSFTEGDIGVPLDTLGANEIWHDGEEYVRYVMAKEREHGLA